MLKQKTKFHRGGWILILCLLAPCVIKAQETRSFSLAAAREYAIHNSYDAQKSQLDVAAAQKRLREIVGIGLPQIQSSIGYVNNLELATVLIPDFFGDPSNKIPVQFGTQHNATAGLTVNQLLFNGSYLVGLKTSKIYTQLADEGLERTQMDIQETVTSTYHLILISLESEKIIHGNLQNLEKTLFEIKEMFKEGFVESTDADMIQISVTSLKNNLQVIQKQTETAYKLLKFQMGLDLEEEIILSDSLEDILADVDVQKALAQEFDLEQNIDFRLTNTQEQLAEMNLKNEKSKFWPSIAVFYNLQMMAQRNAFNFLNFQHDWFRAQTIGFNINIPVFTSGSQEAKVMQASIALDQARNATRQISQALLLEYTQTRNALTAAYENYLNVKDNMEVAKRVYDVTLVKYQEGLSSSTDLTQANDRYLLTQSNYIQAISELLSAMNRLDRIRNTYDPTQKGQRS